MVVKQHDYYEVLGVPRDADARTIKSAFRRLARKHDPGRLSSEERQLCERFRGLSAEQKTGQDCYASNTGG